MSDIDEIKSRINIADYIGKRVQLKKAGRNIKGLCPFHSEKTPSFVVSPERESFHCFGCGKGGDIFSFAMEFEHIDFPEALAELADLAGVKLTFRGGDTPEAKLKQTIFEVNHLASEYYHYLLTKHKLGEKTLLYLKNRGISDKSIKTFSLGYSPNSWDGLLSYLTKKGYAGDLLEKAGLVISRPNGFYDRFRGRVMFTLKDHRGNVVGFSGRVLDPTVKEAKYINTSETPVYSKSHVLYGLDVTKAAIQKSGEAVVMEGELDLISSFQEGISNVVAIKGSALTEGHVHLLHRYAEKILFALDSDLAGDAAARRGIELADRAGFDLRVVVLPSGKDPDEAVRENPIAVKKAIADAIPIYDYFISSSLKRFDVNSAFGKKKISDELMPVIVKIDNPIVQGHYVKRLAATLSTSDETIREGMRRLAKAEYIARSGKKPEETQVTHPDKRETYMLAILLQGATGEFFSELSSRLTFADFEHPAIGKLLIQLEKFLAGNPFSIKAFASLLPPELVPVLDEAFLWDMGDILEDREELIREWKGALGELEKKIVHRHISEITTRMGKSESDAEDDTALQALTDRLKALEKDE